MKTCSSCKEEKSLSEFWKGQCYCVPCHKEKQKTKWASRTPIQRLKQHLKYKYKIEYEDFLYRWNKQNGCCSICKSQLPDLLQYNNRQRGYAIDHNHEDGSFRGILCLNCNSMLGMAKDCIDVLEAAIDYLKINGSYAKFLKASKK